MVPVPPLPILWYCIKLPLVNCGWFSRLNTSARNSTFAALRYFEILHQARYPKYGIPDRIGRFSRDSQALVIATADGGVVKLPLTMPCPVVWSMRTETGPVTSGRICPTNPLTYQIERSAGL